MKWWHSANRRKRRRKPPELELLVLQNLFTKALDKIGSLEAKVDDLKVASPEMRQGIDRSRRMFDIAKQDVGLAEVPGEGSNPRILEIIKQALPDAEDDSKVSWCGIVVADWAKKVGLTPPKDYIVARKWLNFGKEVKQPMLGDVVVLDRPGAKEKWMAHVGLYAGESGDKVNVLGGNQSNKVGVTRFNKELVIGYRRFV